MQLRLPVRKPFRAFHTAHEVERGSEQSIYIGLDPSINHFGVVRVGTNGVVEQSHTIEPKKLTGLKRVEFLITKLTEFIGVGSDTSKPRVIVVREDYSFASHSSSDAMLKELGGVIEWELNKCGITLYKVGVSQVKKYVTGKGNAQKADMMLAVYKTFGVEPINEHIADAIGVAFTARAIVTRNTHSKAQAEVVAAAVKNEHPLTKLPV